MAISQLEATFTTIGMCRPAIHAAGTHASTYGSVLHKSTGEPASAIAAPDQMPALNDNAFAVRVMAAFGRCTLQAFAATETQQPEKTPSAQLAGKPSAATIAEVITSTSRFAGQLRFGAKASDSPSETQTSATGSVASLTVRTPGTGTTRLRNSRRHR